MYIKFFLITLIFFLSTQPMRTRVIFGKAQKLVPATPPLSPRPYMNMNEEDFIVCESDSETNKPFELQTILCTQDDCKYTTICSYHMNLHQASAHQKK